MSRSVRQAYPPPIKIVPPAKATVSEQDGVTYINVELTEEQAAMFRESTLAPQFSIREESA